MWCVPIMMMMIAFAAGFTGQPLSSRSRRLRRQNPYTQVPQFTTLVSYLIHKYQIPQTQFLIPLYHIPHTFHDDWAKNVTSRVFKAFFYYINIRKLPPPPGSHVIKLTGTIFKLNSHIKETNVLTKFHENWAKILTSRVFTCFHYIHIEKNAPPTGTHVFSQI
ncbi:hypothetical protein DPMN_106402 [Dreissena polymorpha]|uniref:Secreted protein n=1 Tax=Dreissena polymorpha TaxID=45954 RepID=A0A9D4QIR0_DREPO|nr:hypothetical protein DPMN_106402 [Dreissena polymorpha]